MAPFVKLLEGNLTANMCKGYINQNDARAFDSFLLCYVLVTAFKCRNRQPIIPLPSRITF